jgi:prolyl-tRNA editing enzyme YbaK/EbsC (Cys-tRNA(Pro) deacylase)
MDASHIALYLKENGLTGEMVRLPEHTPTVEDAARAVGATVERIIKSVLFIADGAPVLVIANGAARVDYKRVADYLRLSRKRVKLADAATVLAVTGFAVGTVPPFGHLTRLRTIVEASVLEQPEVYGGGGAIDTLLRIAPAEIVRAAQAEVVNLVAPNDSGEAE